MNPAKLESALRALYQSGLLLRHIETWTSQESKDKALWEQAMHAAKECLEQKEPEAPICGAIEGQSCCKRESGHAGWHVDGIMSWRSSTLSVRADDGTDFCSRCGSRRPMDSVINGLCALCADYERYGR